jgi:predicted DNA-binding transcriptional regulator AlpA
VRKFPFLTVGVILERLEAEGLHIKRATFNRLEKEGLFPSNRTLGRWRVYDKGDVEAIVKLIKENYKK